MTYADIWSHFQDETPKKLTALSDEVAARVSASICATKPIIFANPKPGSARR